ncbi:UNVERIFIED_CONTAM: hypothetical protein FKN15_029561 [Acipenser sinensis]
MLGKDYMLAIILVNYDDNIWNDQNLEPDSDLPPGWRTIRDSTGTYYWHIPTGTTQWQHPAYSSDGDQAAVSGITITNQKSWSSGGRQIESPLTSISDSLMMALATQLYTAAYGRCLPAHASADSKDQQSSLPWQEEEYFGTNSDPDSKCFAVRSLGWVELPEEDLTPGKSSLAINNCIQQLSHSKCEDRDAMGAWGEGQDMVMILKKDTLSLVDPVDHSLIHCQPIIHIRVWGVGCNNGRRVSTAEEESRIKRQDFAFVASDKDTCMLKCHVFHCDVPAKAIATELHEMCSKIMAEQATMHSSMPRSLTMESISPEDLPLQVTFLDVVRQSVQKFQVLYIGQLPVPRAMGMEVLNRAIENVMNSGDRDDWEPMALNVSDTILALCKGEDRDDPFWECQVRYLTFLGVGQDTHTFAVIVDMGRQRFECRVFWCEPDAGHVSEAVQAACMDGDDPFWECQVRYLTFLGVGQDTHTFAVIVDMGRQRFECRVFWCEPDAGHVSEAVQAACMVQYQKCLVAQTPPLRSKISRSGVKIKRAASMDSSAFNPSRRSNSPPKFGTSSMKKGLLAFFETFKNKQPAVQMP